MLVVLHFFFSGWKSLVFLLGLVSRDCFYRSRGFHDTVANRKSVILINILFRS